MYYNFAKIFLFVCYSGGSGKKYEVVGVFRGVRNRRAVVWYNIKDLDIP